MLKVGITGGIGSGKTTISKIFGVLGIPVFNSDDEAKRVMCTDTILTAAIRHEFGDEAYFTDGSLNRKYIASLVFNNTQKLNTLNSIVHPAVFRAFDAWLAATPPAPYVLKEAALLFESGSYKLCDKTIMVFTPKADRVERVIARDGLTEAEVISRDAKQFTDEVKLQMAHYQIINNNTQLVIPQVLALHQTFLNLAKAQ